MQQLLCFLLLTNVCPSQTSNFPQRTFIDNFSVFYKYIALAIAGGHTSNPKGLQAAKKLNKIQDVIPDSVSFPCDVTNGRSKIRPDDVNHLRPGDIDVIGAMGDSLTAGTASVSSKYRQLGVENRGLSWSGGGQGNWRTFLTLPNVLKEFNPNLIGYALGDFYYFQKGSQFNVGEPIAMSRDMPYMARVLVKRIRTDPRVNFTQDWKMVTIMIGANDFCSDICYDSYKGAINSHERYRKDLIATLDYLRDNLPRTFVNLVVPPNIEILLKFVGENPFCKVSHLQQCPCIYGRSRIRFRPKMISIMRRWQKVVEEVCLLEQYQRKDFAAVMQPFIYQLRLPFVNTIRGNITDFSILAEDCFHFSQKGYSRVVNALWNNILEPVGDKTPNWSETFSKFLCPTEAQPFLRTIGNSGSTAKNLILK